MPPLVLQALTEAVERQQKLKEAATPWRAHRMKWLATARPNQITPPGSWNIWLAMAGRGFGKTRLGAEDVADYAMTNPGVRIAIVAPTFADARDTCVEGDSGLINVIPRECVKVWNRSLGELILKNGSRFKLFSGEEPERLRGPQHHRAWCDELAAWKRPEAFDQLMFGLRLGKDPRCIITTTPKATRLVVDLYKRAKANPEDVHLTTGSTFENAANLAPSALAQLKKRYEGTRLGRQELHAELLEDVQGALWKRSVIDELRLNGYTGKDFEGFLKMIKRIVVAIDPAVSSEEGSNETGIIVAGRMLGSFFGTLDDHFICLADSSGIMSPDEWAKEAVSLFNRFKADKIIGEVNNGGDLIEANLRTINRNLPYRGVHASKGKFVRAEPVAALYEQKRAHHFGSFPQLEDQMCLFTVDFDRVQSKFSPDRMDALVWAGHELMLNDSPEWVTNRPKPPPSLSIYGR